MATTIPSGRTTRATRTRQRILAAALAAFGNEGYKGTSLNSIVASSGLTKGAFYHHFHSKDELAFACHEHLDDHLVRYLHQASYDAPSGLAKVRAILDEWIHVLVTEPELRALGDLPGSYPQNEVALLARAIGEARSEGTIEIETDEIEFARLLCVLVGGATRGSQYPAALVEQCVSLLLKAVAGQDPADERSRRTSC